MGLNGGRLLIGLFLFGILLIGVIHPYYNDDDELFIPPRKTWHNLTDTQSFLLQFARGKRDLESHRDKCHYCFYLMRGVDIEPLIDHVMPTRWERDRLQQRRRRRTRLPQYISLAEAGRRVYLDLGARRYNTSLPWFRTSYPNASDYALKVWDLHPRASAHFSHHPDVEFHREAVWTRKGVVLVTRGRGPHILADPKGWGGHRNVLLSGTVMVRSMDFATYLVKNYELDDFVVCRMDIGGAEFQVVPRLLRTGAIHLIDELWLSCHYGVRRGVPTKQWSDCYDLYSTLREEGVYVHEWL